MKRIVAAASALTALAMAGPAVAQTGTAAQNNNAVQTRNQTAADAALGARIGQLETRLQAGITGGSIDRQEVRTLRPKIRELSRLERQYSRNGLDQTERRDLRNRVRTVRQEIRTADGGSYDRFDRYADNDDDAYYDRYSNSGNAGQGGPYEEVNEACAAPRSGISGVLGALLGSDNCLRVGDRATGGAAAMSAVPSAYRNQFRDGDSSYYRAIGDRVLQIDPRTQIVTRIYDIGE